MAENTLYLSTGYGGQIFRGRPNNQSNSGPIVLEVSGTTETLYQVAANNDPINGGAFTVMISGQGGSILKSSRLGDNPGTWNKVYTSSYPLWAMVYGNGKWIAAGQNDTVLVSTDNGTSWSSHPTGITGALWQWGVYGNGQFVLVGYSGYVAYSSNGITWTRGQSGTSENLYGVEYSPSLNTFVAVGNNGALVTVQG